MYRHLGSSSSPAPPEAAVSQGDVSLNESEMEKLMLLENEMMGIYREESRLHTETKFGLLVILGIGMGIIATIRSILNETGVTAAGLMFAWFLGLALFLARIKLDRLRAKVVLLRECFASHRFYVGKFIDYVTTKPQNTSAIDSNLTDRLNVLQQKSSIGDMSYLFYSHILVISLYVIVLAALIRWFPFTILQNAMIDLLKRYLCSRDEVAVPLSNKDYQD